MWNPRHWTWNIFAVITTCLSFVGLNVCAFPLLCGARAHLGVRRSLYGSGIYNPLLCSLCCHYADIHWRFHASRTLLVIDQENIGSERADMSCAVIVCLCASRRSRICPKKHHHHVWPASLADLQHMDSLVVSDGDFLGILDIQQAHFFPGLAEAHITYYVV